MRGKNVLLSTEQMQALGRIPESKPACLAWARRHGMKPLRVGKGFKFNLSDLPEPERLAYLRRDLDTLELDPGTYDDAAHEALSEASPARRDRAERKAGIVRMLTALRAQGVKEGKSFALVREKFGDKGTSKPSLKRLLKAVQGVDPINYAPALLDDYKATVKRAEFNEEAWQFFLTLIRDAAPKWPLTSAWRDVRAAGKAMGWAVPSYPTFYRHWNELSEAQRLHARQGKAEATKRLTMPALRDKTSIGALAWVSLDGRTQDFWADWGDGKGRVLVVDEAQYLDQKNRKTGKHGEAFEWVRAAAEQGLFHVVFCGDLNLPRAIAKMPQLQSRLLRPVVIKQTSRADVAALVNGTAFANPAAVDALHAVARLKGGLRNVERVTECALDFAGDDAPTLAHIKAAIVDMKLSGEGVL